MSRFSMSNTVVMAVGAAACYLLLLPATAHADNDQLMRSKTGSGNLYEKLVVTSDAAVYVREPTVSAERIPVPAFDVYYRMKTGTKGDEKDGYYRIGTRAGDEKGWIKKEFVTKWNTRFGLEPTLPQPDRYFTIYKDGEGKTAYIKFDPRDRPVPGGTRRFALITNAPLAETSDEVYPVAVFTGATESGGAKKKELMALYNLKLEVVFVIDTTASMEPLIEVARSVTRETANSLAAMPEVKDLVHFGLVEYRDGPPNAEFDARIPCRLTNDHSKFWNALDSLSVSDNGDNDILEDMVAGLDQANHNVGWQPNSSKHVIILGDAPAKDGHDPVTDEDYASSTKKSLADILREARPQGGGTDDKALGAKNFHAVSNNHAPLIDTVLDSDSFKEMSAEEKKALKDLVEKPELVKLVRQDPNRMVQAFINEGFGKDAAKALVFIIQGNDMRNRWQSIVQTQLQMLAANDGELQGYYTSINTYQSPDDESRAIKGLTGALNAAYQTLASVRDGKKGGGVATADGPNASISAGIYQIVGTKGDAKLEPVVQGHARTRDENGRLVAHKKVMVFKDELMGFYSALDSLHTKFKNKSNKADRQNVSEILDDLKEAVASQAAGQKEIGEGTELTEIIKFDFPVKTPALDTSAKEIGQMSTPAFNNWLESLATARDRAKTLVLGGKQDWTTLNNDDEDQFVFLALSELP